MVCYLFCCVYCLCLCFFFFFFFFQAEDGIRDTSVTGVQTCALPIYRQRDERRRAHREDVVERVRRGDRAEVAGIVDDRREEVDGEDERALVVELVDRRVIGGREPDEEIRIGLDRQGADEGLQQRRRVLRRAASTRYELREPDLAGRGHLPTL